MKLKNLKSLYILTLLLCGVTAFGQYTPPPVGAYQYSGSSWIATTTSATSGAIQFTPPPAALYCYNSGTSQWVPATSACFGGGGGSFTALTGDATSTSTGGATTVKGLNSTLLSGLATGVLGNTTSTGVPFIYNASNPIPANFLANYTTPVQGPVYPTTYLLSVLNGNDQTGPKEYLSQDGFSLLPMTKGGQVNVYIDNVGFRDPRVIKIGATYYLSYTNTTLAALNATSIGLAYSTDMQNWTKVTTPNWSSFIGGSQSSIVQGCWWVDPSGNYWMIMGPAAPNNLTGYYVQFFPATNTFGTPTAITWSDGTGNKMPMAVWTSAGTTWALIQATGFDSLYSFSTISGTWTLRSSGNNWAGWLTGTTTTAIESGAMVILPSGNLRAYFVDANGAIAGGNTYYSNCSTSNPLTCTWSASVAISPFTPYSTNAAGVIADWIDVVPFADIQSDQTFNALERSNPPADIQIIVPTTTINANSCSSLQTAPLTGLTTTMTVHFTPSTDIHSVTGWSSAGPTLYFVPVPTANSLTYYVCNNSVGNITPGAATTWNVSAK